MNSLQRNMRRWYYNIPINTKLNITNLVIIIIPMVLLAVTSNKVSSDILVEKSVNSSVQELDVVRRSLDSLLNQVEYLSKLTAVNAVVQNVIGLHSDQQPLFLEQRIDVGGALEDMVGEKAIISGESIITKGDFIVTSGDIDPARFAQMEATLTSVRESGRLKKGQISYESTKSIDYYAHGEHIDGIAAYRYLLNKSGEIRGLLRIDIDQRTIANLLPATVDEIGEVFIVDDTGQVIVSQNQQKLYQTIRTTDYFGCLVNQNKSATTFCTGGNNLLAISLNYDRAGWRIVRLIPTKYLTEDSNKVTALILLAMLVCISLAIGAALLNSRAISRPITRLAQEMGNAGMGDMEVRFNSEGNDEIGILGRSFNLMMERITELMDRVYMEQKRKREFEFMALQAQINPHFLYNTLESVCALTLKHNNNDVIIMVKSLALFYRSILSQGRNVISIQEEIENVRHYLAIQKIRYGDKFDYLFEIDPQINDKSIVKLIIQPLVENAIYHGIKQKQGKGLIVIMGKAEGQSITISVLDDGIGFSNADSILNAAQPRREYTKNHYGLRNVDERIKLYFGPDFGLAIQSVPGSGTRVDVVLSAQTYEQ